MSMYINLDMTYRTVSISFLSVMVPLFFLKYGETWIFKAAARLRNSLSSESECRFLSTPRHIRCLKGSKPSVDGDGADAADDGVVDGYLATEKPVCGVRAPLLGVLLLGVENSSPYFIANRLRVDPPGLLAEMVKSCSSFSSQGCGSCAHISDVSSETESDTSAFGLISLESSGC